jgi:hypothetical protein
MRLLAGALGLAAALALPAPPALGIAHGVGAPAGAYPWMATLVWNRGHDNVRDLHCGATLIAPDRLLTAAHCVAGLRPRAVRAYLGADRLTHPPRGPLRIARFRTLAGYRVVPSPVRPHDFGASATVNDAAVVLLATPVRDVRPVALPGPLDGLLAAPGTAALALGHGRTTAGPRGRGPDRGAPTDPLRQAGQAILAPARCRAVFGRLFARGQLCAQAPAGAVQAGACPGDSGGPLIVGDVLRGPVEVGIVIYGGETEGARCEGGRYPDVYTSTASLAAFLGR